MKKKRKGLVWNIAHSWWILLTFTFVLNWVAFLYVGLKVKKKRWAMYGGIYAIPFLLSYIPAQHSENNTSSPIWGLIFLLGGVISMVHAFKIRKEFLTRLEARQYSKKYLNETLIQQIESEYGLGTGSKFEGPVPTTIFTRGPLTRQS